MKALFATLVALALTACSTFSPVQSVKVYPAAAIAQPAIVHIPMTVPTVTARYTPPEPMVDEAELTCMALAIYHEARGEPSRGQAAVGWVIMNRLHSGKYPTTICGIVQQAVIRNGRIVRNRCQFSWYCDGKDDTPKNWPVFEKSKAMARAVITGQVANPVGNSLFFDGFVHQRQTAKRKGFIQIGNHRFYAVYARR